MLTDYIHIAESTAGQTNAKHAWLSRVQQLVTTVSIYIYSLSLSLCVSTPTLDTRRDVTWCNVQSELSAGDSDTTLLQAI